MEKDKILNFLDKFDFNYSNDNQKIVVNLDFAQKVIIELKDGDKIKISDKLTGWNFLTGLISMSLKNAMVYNFVGGIIIGFLFITLQLRNSEINMVPIYLVFILWVLMFSVYYLIKLESFKNQVMNFINKTE